MKKMKLLITFLTFVWFTKSCSSSSDGNENPDPETEIPDTEEPPEFYLGADLSYVNEMEDCGATYKNKSGNELDPYKIFSEAGTNLVRVRLWHNAGWTEYSDFEDAKKTISRAKAEGMDVLLDFHYSDDWADPARQEIPAAWVDQINNTEALGDLLYDYTYKILDDLSKENLLPEFVQVGNEINGMILQQEELVWPIDWERNSSLLNKGIKAVRDISTAKSKEIGVMLHIAQPENALWWFEQATENGVTDFDWIGLSYYPIWSDYTIENIGTALSTLINTYDKRLMIVETAYPFTMENADAANNILGEDAIIDGYPATQQGQYNYLKALYSVVEEAGGEGIIYWEPAWVSTDCSTQWGQGSHWDNATLFDHNYQVTKGIEFYNETLSE